MSSVAVDAIDESVFQPSAGSIDSLGDDRLCSGMAVPPVGWWQLVAQCSAGSSRSQTCGPGPVKSGRELEGRPDARSGASSLFGALRPAILFPKLA